VVDISIEKILQMKKQNTKLKILMLGWEFPPIVNGGLGVACYGIAKELAKIVDLTLIVPKSSLEFKLDKLNLIGLNHQEDYDSIKREESKLEIFENIHSIDSELTPYSENHDNRGVNVLKDKVSNHHSDKTEERPINVFSSQDVYDSNLRERVVEFTKSILEITQDMSFDVIYAHDWMTFAAAVELKRKTKKPVVLHIHSLAFDRSGETDKGWAFLLEKQGMRQADAVIPVSRYTGRICTQHYNVDFKKIYPIHNAIEKIKPFRVSSNFDDKLVLFLGRLTSQKGPGVFLEIAEKVLNKTPKVKFVIAGKGDLLRELLQNPIYKELNSKIHFTGFLTSDRVKKLFARTDVYCMPSVSEPFGLSALEAVQFGIPPVISKQSGVAEVLNSALKADYWDTTLMARHILDLLENKKTRESVIKNCQNDLSNVTWRASVNKIEEVLQKVSRERT